MIVQAVKGKQHIEEELYKSRKLYLQMLTLGWKKWKTCFTDSRENGHIIKNRFFTCQYLNQSTYGLLRGIILSSSKTVLSPLKDIIVAEFSNGYAFDIYIFSYMEQWVILLIIYFLMNVLLFVVVATKIRSFCPTPSVIFCPFA